MEEPMRVVWEPLKKNMMVAGCLLLALPLGVAQKKPAESPAGETRAMVVEKARALESRGRPDMAVQLWQQILLSEPNNADALAGLARDYKLMGASDKASQTLDRLRRVNPNDPNIARIEALSSSQTQSEDLRRAGDLARQGKADDAMAIYRRLYGDHPPDDNIGAAYYQTLYATATGKAAGVAGMRDLAARHPGDESFEVSLGTMLTFDPRTRAEGIRILMAIRARSPLCARRCFGTPPIPHRRPCCANISSAIPRIRKSQPICTPTSRSWPA
jgi:predicted Zn-dependent protease